MVQNQHRAAGFVGVPNELLQHFRPQHRKGFIYPNILFGAHLHKGSFILLGQNSAFVCLDNSLLICDTVSARHITFVGQDNLDHILVRFWIYLVHPFAYFFERFAIRYGVDKNNPRCPRVIVVGQSAKSLLSCRIPQLQLHYCRLQIQCLGLEVHSDGGRVW